MRFRVAISAVTLSAAAWRAADAQQASGRPPTSARAEVLVLGVYHMANPGRDIVNTRADDVLAPKRQAEIAELVSVLAKFRPTKIAVEEPFNSDAIVKRYAEYVAGSHELTRNETQQIGFRLAKQLGHKTIYPVDVDGEFPYPRLLDYAKARGRSAEFETLMGEAAERVKATSAYLASHTILESLLLMNSDERAAIEVGHYYRMAHFSEPWNWAGPDLVADWFRRNVRIYGNIVRLADSPAERVLVIYGSGHLGWLQQMFASDPDIRLRKLAEFAK